MVDDVCAYDGYISSRYGRRITATIDILNTRLVAPLNDDLCRCSGNFRSVLSFLTSFVGVQFRVCRPVVGLIATTIDSRHIVGGAVVTRHRSRLLAAHRSLYMHLNVSFWRTIQVVTTKYLSRERCLAVSDGSQSCTVEQHIDVAAYICQHLIVVFTGLLSQSTTEDITYDSAPVEADFSPLCRVEYQCFCRLACVHATQCTTAVDVAVNCCPVSRLCGRADIHMHTVLHQCRLTKATAEDHVVCRAIALVHCSHRAACNGHRRSPLQHTVSMAATVDGRLHRSPFHRDCRVAKVQRCMAFLHAAQSTAIDAATDGTGINIDRGRLSCRCR